MIGQTLGGRYELLDRIGGGGMALVYKARDLLLGRFVAVKVLRQQFVHDEEFVRRFRREAQAAASLSHPNIVSIYDVGKDEDTHFIVMEYVDGHNLNEIIRDRAPLQTEEAVRIASQICDALDHAHHNQIIHRDIKPHNILIGNNGRVKVTDFGIARAVTSSTITQTGSVVGSVHYFSPEHAKGVATGEKSDIYSLGIVLYQMLTGRLPFLGESPISVALKHLQEPFEEPRLVNPHIPQSVENIILRAMRKNPQERYPSAKRMLDDLETCLQPERLREPRVEFGSEDEEDEKTRVIPALKPDMRMSGQETIAKGDEAKRGEEDEEEYEDEPRRRRWVLPTVLSVLAVILIGILIWAVMSLKGSLSPKDVPVPTVEGEMLADAKADLTKVGLLVADPPLTEPSDSVDEGKVIRQDKKDMTVKEGATITLTVSTGPELATMKSFKDMSYDDAVQQLTDLGVSQDRIKKADAHDESDAGTVIEQDPPADTQFDPKKDTVTLTVSQGPEKVQMPNLIGMTLDQAKEELQKDNLVLDEANLSYEPSYTVQNQVFKQFPNEPGEQVDPGTKVKLWISSGYPDNAKKINPSVTVYPKEDGKDTSIRITVDDARGQDIEAVKSTKIKSATTFYPELVLAPGQEGKIKVYQDNALQSEIPVPYEGDIPASTEPDTGATVSPPPDPNGQTTDGTGAQTGDGTDGQPIDPNNPDNGGQDQGN
ncbi:Stk1 family PASTA domain-containing Ser/Thr kinase [Cohnella zeiphila]|uniref:Serine/threonine-protein kinase PrkC n=1 Tax=Cohnella zeiphila TaxID=2761120 RepID=A0A7X0STS4_9BACL|nr:Stk1 family PASTA domain-containing Ser/Thr kinase [Cohnella zeiphila]MBB6735851.1 Stk1 family PASTA domain-containing Ser/Thr kinase [Cohnella zeiphila]